MLKEIQELFKNREKNMIGSFKKSSVMILITEEEKPSIIFEVRAFTLRHQPGDICLPGGRIEAGESPKEAAIRETCEELNLKEEDIEVIGEMDYLVTPYGAIIYPFVAILKNNNIHPNKDEVDHIFKVSISDLVKDEPYLYELPIGPKLSDDFPYERIQGGKNYKFGSGSIKEYFYKYENYNIWGFTALIIKEFTEIIEDLT